MLALVIKTYQKLSIRGQCGHTYLIVHRLKDTTLVPGKEKQTQNSLNTK